MDDKVLRSQVVDLLQGGHAHAQPAKILEGLEPRLRTTRPAAGVASVWELLEHLRISQEDILRYTLDPAWKSPDWPAGYWPREAEKVSDAAWNQSAGAFLSDLKELIALAKDPKRDLTAAIPHGEGRTYLRELLLAADHNAYHLAQVVTVRKMLGGWKG